MKSLLYATDYSENSLAALKLAEMLRKKHRANLHVLHVFDMSATFVSTLSLTYSRMEKKAFQDHKKKLLAFCETHLGSAEKDAPWHIALDENSISSDGILEKARVLGADLILVGMKGSTTIMEFLTGSTTDALIEKSPIPVLAVPEDFEPKAIKTLIYATAFEEADIRALQHIIALVQPFKTAIKLIHVATRKEYASEDQLEWFKEMLRQKITYKRLSFDLIYSDDILSTLKTYIKEGNPQLIAMLEREDHSDIKSLWQRDTIKQLKSDTQLPLLIYPKRV